MIEINAAEFYQLLNDNNIDENELQCLVVQKLNKLKKDRRDSRKLYGRTCQQAYYRGKRFEFRVRVRSMLLREPNKK